MYLKCFLTLSNSVSISLPKDIKIVSRCWVKFNYVRELTVLNNATKITAIDSDQDPDPQFRIPGPGFHACFCFLNAGKGWKPVDLCELLDNGKGWKPVNLCELLGNVLEHILHALPRPAARLVDTRHQVVTLFTTVGPSEKNIHAV
jgi:hypothetical protein